MSDKDRLESSVDQQVRLISERLYGDERLRSRLNDTEGKVVLAWGQKCLMAAAAEAKRASNDRVAATTIEGASLRIRAAIAGINDLIGDKARLSDSQLRRALAGLVMHSQSQSSQVNALVDELIAKHQTMNNREFIDHLTTVIELSWRTSGSIP
jgi:hypothetical protein